MVLLRGAAVNNESLHGGARHFRHRAKWIEADVGICLAATRRLGQSLSSIKLLTKSTGAIGLVHTESSPLEIGAVLTDIEIKQPSFYAVQTVRCMHSGLANL